MRCTRLAVVGDCVAFASMSLPTLVYRERAGIAGNEIYVCNEKQGNIDECIECNKLNIALRNQKRFHSPIEFLFSACVTTLELAEPLASFSHTKSTVT